MIGIRRFISKVYPEPRIALEVLLNELHYTPNKKGIQECK
jgi:hypothetical protein